MGFLDLFSKTVECGFCGNSEAKKKIGGRTQCSNPLCPYYYAVASRESHVSMGEDSAGNSRMTESIDGQWVAIYYKNFKGEQQVFVLARNSIIRKKNRITKLNDALRQVDSQLFSLSCERIQNLKSLEAIVPQLRSEPLIKVEARPRGRDLQILSYHHKNRSTSPLHEKIKAKYPNWP